MRKWCLRHEERRSVVRATGTLRVRHSAKRTSSKTLGRHAPKAVPSFSSFHPCALQGRQNMRAYRRIAKIRHARASRALRKRRSRAWRFDDCPKRHSKTAWARAGVKRSEPPASGLVKRFFSVSRHSWVVQRLGMSAGRFPHCNLWFRTFVSHRPDRRSLFSALAALLHAGGDRVLALPPFRALSWVRALVQSFQLTWWPSEIRMDRQDER